MSLFKYFEPAELASYVYVLPCVGAARIMREKRFEDFERII